VLSDDELTQDGFLSGRLMVLQPRKGYRAGTDPVLLAAAVDARPGESVLELGCGVGVASLCLGWRVPGVALTGVEIQPEYAGLATRNAAANEISMTVLCADLRALPGDLRARSFDHVFANPPYFRPGSSTPAVDPGRETANTGATRLEDWLETALRRLSPGGTFTIIHRVDRLQDVLIGLGRRAASIVIQPLASRAGRDAERMIVRARKGGRGGVELKTPLILHDGAQHVCDGDSFSARARAILRDGAPLALQV